MMTSKARRGHVSELEKGNGCEKNALETSAQQMKILSTNSGSFAQGTYSCFTVNTKSKAADKNTSARKEKRKLDTNMARLN